MTNTLMHFSHAYLSFIHLLGEEPANNFLFSGEVVSFSLRLESPLDILITEPLAGV